MGDARRGGRAEQRQDDERRRRGDARRAGRARTVPAAPPARDAQPRRGRGRGAPPIAAIAWTSAGARPPPMGAIVASARIMFVVVVTFSVLAAVTTDRCFDGAWSR